MERQLTTLRSFTLAAALIVSATAANAKVETFDQSGAWSAFAGSNNEGVPMCGMTVHGDNSRRMAMIKWQLGSNSIFVQLYKQSWRVPVGTEMPIEIQFDRAEPFRGIATSFNKGGMLIEATIKNDSGDGSYETLKSFMALFGAASQMYFAFPGGNENSWVAPMNGSEKIGRSFVRCIDTYEKNGTQPHGGAGTQPHQGGGSTQPFGRKPNIANDKSI
jgi:hypothetical protein